MKSYTNKERVSYAKSITEHRPPNVIHNKRLFMDSSISIGKDGFGFAREDDGTLIKMPHRGNVVIEEDVEIGIFTCIDRAVTGSTIIGKGTKIDNLVHVGHGAHIGKHCLIVAGAVIGGSSVIGDRCFIGMGAMIKNKIVIGNDVTIGAGAVVLRDVPDGETWVGNPARKLAK